MADIFVSYASEDLDRVKPLIAALEQRGFTVWWDREIHPGTSWDQAIERELDSATWIISLWTENSVGSRWVRSESMAALERDALLPVLLDDVTLPVAFRTTQVVDLRSWPADDANAAFDRLVGHLHGTPHPPPADANRAPEPGAHKNRRGRLTAAIALASLTAVAVIWFALPDATEAPASETIAVTSFAGQPSIAVLPFEHGSDPEDRPFANGLTDEIIKGLQQYRTIPVISRHATFTLRDQGMSLQEMASRLGARYLVTGAVSRRGDRLRVSAGLTNAEGRQLWKDSFEVDFLPQSVFDLQDQIAQQIAGVSYPQLLEGEINRVAKRDIGSLDAWGHAMNAVEIINGVNVDLLDEGLLHAERALDLDPNLPVAYWARAEIKVYQLVELGLTGESADIMEEEILEDFQEALDISPFDGALCGCLGFVRVMRGEIEEAVAVFDAVLPINPSNALLRMNYATLLTHQGKLEAARREAELALRLDPLSRFGSMSWSTLGLVEASEGDLEQAISMTRRALQVEGDETYGQAQLPLLLYLDDRIAAAQDAFADLMKDHPRWNPRNKLSYGWFRPIEAMIRENVAQKPEAGQTGQSLPDLLEWIFRDLGWKPPDSIP